LKPRSSAPDHDAGQSDIHASTAQGPVHCRYERVREGAGAGPRPHREVQALLAARGLANVRLEMRGPETYAALTGYPDAHFDFALVDGTDRAGCVASVLPKLRPGGWIYLDNSDKDMTLADGNLRRAEAVLVEAARRCGGPVRYFVDFSPTNFFVEQGMLVQITAHS